MGIERFFMIKNSHSFHPLGALHSALVRLDLGKVELYHTVNYKAPFFCFDATTTWFIAHRSAAPMSIKIIIKY
jgi:hypothetical protein